MKAFKLMLNIKLVFYDKFKGLPKSLHYLVVIFSFLTYYNFICLDLKKKTGTSIKNYPCFHIILTRLVWL